ncbi:hypothetical protein QUF74_16085 [Candidatus Halobeggiatoa sp. HSG11]|nr:hypothetical protein [Candidatus Halobeggiatoa sp. HSG11]
MLAYLFIGVYAFVLMGIPIIVTIAFIYGIVKAYSDINRQAKAKLTQQTARVHKYARPDYRKPYKVILALSMNKILPRNNMVKTS